MKDIIVMCPTVRIATQKYKEFLNANNNVRSFNKAQLLVRLTNGINIYFRGETEGQRAFLGMHADIKRLEEIKLEEIKRELNKGGE